MRTKTKIYAAAALGIAAGLLSLLSGAVVLLGINVPDYTVIQWLVIYNVIMGAASVSVGLSIFLKSRWVFKSALFVTFAHLTVLIILLGLWYFSPNAVATQSLGAMTFRSILWAGIAWVVWKNYVVPGKRPGADRARTL